MTWRTKLADWISGGAITRATEDWTEGWEKAWELDCAMQAIIACETPNANATVKRMAKIAREAVK